MKNRLTLAALVLAVVCTVILNGCTDPKSAAAGTYEIDKSAIKAAAEAEMKAKGQSDPATLQMLTSMIDSVSMTMTLNADGTATMSQSAGGQSSSASGTWTVSGKTITITAGEAGEKPEPVTGTIDGDTIRLTPPKGQNVPFDMVFKRRKS